MLNVADLGSFLSRAQADVASFIEGLLPAQLSLPSLCSEWMVGDIAAHLVSNIELSVSGMVLGTITAGLRPNRLIAKHAKCQPRRTPAEIAVCLRSKIGTVGESDLSVFFVDTLVHHQDMRRPLDAPREIPGDRLGACLDTVVTLGFPFGGNARAKDLRFEATDVAWQHGDGPRVTGPDDSLLLALGGRPAAVTELGGEGAALFGLGQRN